MQVLVFLWHSVSQQKLVSGGLIRFLEIARRIRKYGVRVTAIDNFPSIRRFDERPKYEVIEYRIPLSQYDDQLFFRMMAYIYAAIKMAFLGTYLCRKQHFDLLISPSGEDFCTAFPAYLTHVITKTPLLFIQQQVPGGTSFEGITRKYKQYQEYGFGKALAFLVSLYAFTINRLLVTLYNRVPLIVTVGESLMAQLRTNGVRTKLYVLGNGINLEPIDKVIYKGPKKYEAIFVGRHSPEKGIFDLIEVWDSVVKVLPKALLVLVGYSVKKVSVLLDTKIREYGLEKNIIRVGVVSDEKKSLLMKQSKLLIFLSKQEASPLTPAEALACDLPVVCYDIPPMREWYNCDSVIRCKIGNKSAVSKKVLELIWNEPQRKRLSEKARDFVTRFDWETIAKKEAQIYHRYVQGKMVKCNSTMSSVAQN